MVQLSEAELSHTELNQVFVVVVVVENLSKKNVIRKISSKKTGKKSHHHKIGTLSRKGIEIRLSKLFSVTPKFVQNLNWWLDQKCPVHFR